ncbi:MAG: tRNA (N6-isopentenyl adenosine(37)-C2)-methylthiotransferase MiaB [Oscillospiraceae bacterium]|nr:tRNA (N6-isopentenyl adenosine(37)-C2)-methylthiotransferase MiaB [Oscillospiraceae bacterium]
MNTIRHETADTYGDSRSGARHGKRPAACTRTFGCQQNEADTERLRGQLSAMGYALTDKPGDADLMLLNTCAVREHAESRAWGHIGELSHWKAARPGRVLVLCGCMAALPENAEKAKRSYPHVDILVEPRNIDRFPDILRSFLRGAKHGRYTDIPQAPDYASGGYDAPRRGAPPRAWMPVISGCDNYCSYCIVPHTRGRERSLPMGGIAAEIAALIEKGYKDFTLLGQNVNSYRDPDGGGGFPELLRRVCENEGDYLVRFMTSHPKDCSPALIEAMAGLKPVAPHLHLPVQSGSDRVLDAMNRGYTAARYLSLLDSARAAMPSLTVTSDIMVGFPGETDGDFEDTLSLTARARFDMLFTFIYSPRAGTPAAQMPDLPREVKQRRFERLLELQNGISHEKHAALEGTVQRVLADGYEPGNDLPLTARTPGGRLARLDGGPEWVGRFARAEITSHTTWNLFGKIIGEG